MAVGEMRLPGTSTRSRKVCASSFAVIFLAVASSWLLLDDAVQTEEAFVNAYDCRVSRKRGLVCRDYNFIKYSEIKGTWKYKRISTEWDDAEPSTILPYGSKEKEEWLPFEKWSGTDTWRPTAKIQDDGLRQWFHFDAEKKNLEDLGYAVARVLMGLDSPLWCPRGDVGGYAIVTNCDRVRVPGKQYHYKLYLRNLSSRPGHIKVERFRELIERFPERIIMRAVWEAMPTNKRNKRIFKERLKIFAGPNHLYNNKDVIEFPMHKVQDVTYEDSLRDEDLFVNRMNNNKVRDNMKAEWKEYVTQVKKLKRFKTYMKEYIEKNGGEEAFKDRDFQEVYSEANDARMRQKYVESIGVEAPKQKKRFYWKNYLPKPRVNNEDATKGDYAEKNPGLGRMPPGGLAMPKIRE
eukprot:CAMPEP_0197664318 /NCGR_PEP_ID=MMETSP1338-20131121/58558_1 /TAXON_ID=43686 ORGANISM="Pelagodinium beii, Strain RCC1491" /NCGR_SAMPLE_ID=MMETSP1338 /ASSEMBLY_ACC=CAM_ASM_000754 /LENGTH=405 /DNA_ID=CAMNT_0043242931 /DNA_START=62 /DNA_END=1279 /DNA_ORIENTATION=-